MNLFPQTNSSLQSKIILPSNKWSGKTDVNFYGSILLNGNKLGSGGGKQKNRIFETILSKMLTVESLIPEKSVLSLTYPSHSSIKEPKKGLNNRQYQLGANI